MMMMMMMIMNPAGNSLRNLVRRWQDLSQGPNAKIPLLEGRVGRREMVGSSENLMDWLLDPEEELEGRRNWAKKVPRGYLAVYVGAEMRRFVIPASYLRVPAMRELMERAEEEFGYEQRGGLRIPCEEAYFEEILTALERKKKIKNRKLPTKTINIKIP